MQTCAYLAWKYPRYELLRRGDNTYPVVVFPAPKTQITEPDSVLAGGLEKNPPGDERPWKRDVPYRIKMTQSSQYNGNTYAMRSLATGEQLCLACQMGRYFDCYETCYALAHEMRVAAEGFAGHLSRDIEGFDRQLPMRNHVHARVKDPVHDGALRSAAIGVSVLIAYRHEGDLWLWLKRRSSEVGPEPLKVHVVPSFMFRPATEEFDAEFSVCHNFGRQYLQELFDRDDPTEGPTDRKGFYLDPVRQARCDSGGAARAADRKGFYLDPVLQYLDGLMRAGQAELFLSGVTFDLLALRPDICMLLLIRCPEWYEWHTVKAQKTERFAPNYEWIPPGQGIGRIRFSTDEREIVREASLTADQMTAPGAGAFWLGVDLLKEFS